MTAHTHETHTASAEPKPERKRRNLVPSYNATVKISIPHDTSDLDSIGTSVNSIKGLRDHLPPGSTVEVIGASFGKMEPPAG